MKRLVLAAALLVIPACAHKKVSIQEAFGPVLTVHTLPAGSEILRNGTSLGHAPIDLPLKPGVDQIALEAKTKGFIPVKVTLDAAGPRRAGGADAWIALKPLSMGTDTPSLNAGKPRDLDRAGIYLSRDKHCALAEQYFRRALAVNPHYLRAYRDRAHCLILEKRYDRAATELEIYMDGAQLDKAQKSKIADLISRLQAHKDIDLGSESELP